MLRERNKRYGTIKFVDISSDAYSPEDNQGLDYKTVCSLEFFHSEVSSLLITLLCVDLHSSGLPIQCFSSYLLVTSLILHNKL